MTTSRRIAVIGTGAIGAMALWSLAKTPGVTAVGFDSYSPGHDRGAIGGESRIFRRMSPEGPDYHPLTARSSELWDDLQTTSSTKLLIPTKGLFVSNAGSEAVTAMAADLAASSAPHTVLDSAEVRSRYPRLKVGDSAAALVDESAGVLRPDRAVRAAIAAASALGAEYRADTPVLAAEELGSGATVRTAAGEERFDAAVIATGPWSPACEALSALPLEAHEITTAWFPVERPEDFSPDRWPVAIIDGEQSISCFPTLDGDTVKVSQHSVSRPVVASASKIQRNPPDHILHTLRTSAAAHLDGLIPHPVRLGTYADCFTPDRHGVVGSLPGSERLIAAVGFSGHGFKSCPALGEAAAALACGRSPDVSVDHLSPLRFH